MKNKVLIEVIVPSIEESYQIYLPVNKKIGNIISLLNKAIYDLSNESFVISSNYRLYSGKDGSVYPEQSLLIDTDIRNGSRIILL